ncbi:hypothetical protein X975_08944, partial [Stegodyphus mimosarum]
MKTYFQEEAKNFRKLLTAICNNIEQGREAVRKYNEKSIGNENLDLYTAEEKQMFERFRKCLTKTFSECYE